MDAIALNFVARCWKGWLSKGKTHPTKTRLFSLFSSWLSFGLLRPGGEESSLPVSLLCLLHSLFKNLINNLNSLSLASTLNTAQGLCADDIESSTRFLPLHRAEEASGKCRTEKPASERSFPDQDPGVSQGVLHTNGVPDRHHDWEPVSTQLHLRRAPRGLPAL